MCKMPLSYRVDQAHRGTASKVNLIMMKWAGTARYRPFCVFTWQFGPISAPAPQARAASIQY
jgi:hypothetical protein